MKWPWRRSMYKPGQGLADAAQDARDAAESKRRAEAELTRARARAAEIDVVTQRLRNLNASNGFVELIAWHVTRESRP